jgi:hemin uptake protein HemP
MPIPYSSARQSPLEPEATQPSAKPTAVHTTGGTVRASDLLGPHQAVEIEHNGQRYRLQSTKAGKLILTK